MSGEIYENVTSEAKPPVPPVEVPKNDVEKPCPSEPAKAVAKKIANEEVDEFGLPIKRTVRRKTLEEEEGANVLTNGSLGTLDIPNGPSAVTAASEADEKDQDPKEEPKDAFATPKETPSPRPASPEPTQAPRERSTSQPSRTSSADRNRTRSRATTLERQIRDRSRSHSSKRNSTLRSAAENRQSTHNAPSEWSHQQLAPQLEWDEEESDHEGKWQDMPAYAPFDIYNDDGKLIAREQEESDEEAGAYGQLGGAGKGYTKVQLDEDAQSATSMDDNTAYLFKERGTNVQDEDDEARDTLLQLQTTKSLLTEGQKIAYVGLVRLAMMEMLHLIEELDRTKGSKKVIDFSTENQKMWGQKMMVRLYSHMDIASAEQIMIEQLAEHGIQPADLAPQLRINSRVKNPGRNSISSDRPSFSSPRASLSSPRPPSPSKSPRNLPVPDTPGSQPQSPLPAYEECDGEDLPAARIPSELPDTQTIDVDIRWTVLCDLFLVLIADSLYDARSRRLLEIVGSYLDVPWLDICRFEKRVTDALEMQEAADKENWNEDEHMENRRKLARNRRLMMMGLATVGGGLVIGLSAGLLAPVIGAGLAAGFTTIGVAGTSGFLAGAGGAAIITTTGVVTGGAIAVKASNRRTSAVKTFEYRPLHNNKRVNLIVSVSGWMTGKVDDVRLPFSTVDPIMGDIYSVYWEPEMLQSMGQTINILATEALTQGLQQVLGSTILIGLMAALQLPIVLTKLAYLIDNPWSVSVTRAEGAGLILADSLIDRNLGSRPVTLVGFSIGARVIFSCLRELARKGQCGLVQNAYLFGTPVVANRDEYIKARAVVSGRFVNAYATNDWILGYLFRATSGGIMRVAGLAPVEIPGIENIDVTSLVPGHMSYRKVMPKLLREAGWAIESDEFTEIEDPDPENHEKRQRELISEIEEARKQLEEKPQKKSMFSFFSKKKQAAKREWETYDDRSKELGDEKSGDDKDENVLFDIEAIRKEIAAISAEGFEIKELESTLPPMKLDLSAAEHPPLRQTKSDGYVSDAKAIGEDEKGLPELPPPKLREQRIPELELEAHNQNRAVSMTFETEYDEESSVTPAKSAFSSSLGSPPAPIHDKRETSPFRREPSPFVREPSPFVREPSPFVREPSPFKQDPPSIKREPSPSFQRPPLTHATTVAPIVGLNHNVWADEDEFGQEREMKMTFE